MNKMLDGDDAKKTAADPKACEQFLNDMHQALGIATGLLK